VAILIVGDYKLVVTINYLPFLGPVCISGSALPFMMWIFAAEVCRNRSGGA